MTRAVAAENLRFNTSVVAFGFFFSYSTIMLPRVHKFLLLSFYLHICFNEKQETELFRGVAGFPAKSGRITSLEN